MFHPDFRRRPKLLIYSPSHDDVLDAIDVPGVHLRLARVLDAEITKRVSNAASVGDDLADTLLAAMSRLVAHHVRDPFGLYAELVLLPGDVLQDLYNHYLTEDDGCIGTVVQAL